MTTGTSSLTQTTPFPNVLLDEVMPLLKDTEWRLLCVIVRQTLGWQGRRSGRRKTSDWLTQRQLRERTGRDAEALSRAVATLLERSLIVVWNEAGQPLHTVQSRRIARGRVYYGLHPAVLARIGVDLQMTDPKSESVSSLMLPQPKTFVPKSESETPQNNGLNSPKANRTKETVTKPTFTKETATKEILTKIVKDVFEVSENRNPQQHPYQQPFGFSETEFAVSEAQNNSRNGAVPEAQVAQFLALYRAQFQERRGRFPPPISAADRQQLHCLLEKYSFAALAGLLEIFFTADIAHIRRQGYSLGAFVHSVNILQAAKRH